MLIIRNAKEAKWHLYRISYHLDIWKDNPPLELVLLKAKIEAILNLILTKENNEPN